MTQPSPSAPHDSAARCDATNADPQQVIAQLQEQLAAAQRLATLGELAGTMAHEFNNILTTTINYAKLGLRHRDAATRDKAFEKILAAGQRAAKLTHSVLGVSRGGSDRREPVDLPGLVEDTLLLLERDLSKHRVSVERDLQATPAAWGSPHQLQQVLMNLLINARQAMPNGGRVRVSTRHHTAENWAELVVRDSGVGIDAEQLPRIFDAFYTTKRGPDAGGQGGTGLGLSTCRQIIESHRGRIRVESTPGRGTAFTIRLPLAESQTHAA